MKHRLYIAAVNQRYGRNVFLPLVAGLLWGYARRQPGVASAVELGGMLYLKEPVEDAVARLDRPEILALSSYIWNHEWNKAFARAVKKRWPGCAIVVGGVQVAEKSPKVLEECEAFDFAIYGEGEGAFGDFLRTFIQGASLVKSCACGGVTCDVCVGRANEIFSRVGSLVWHARDGIVVNERHGETPLGDIPSPYLAGLFDEIVKEERWSFQALQETNRGCPYSCTFCAWGAASLTKLRQFSDERIAAELDWMGRNKIEFLYNADANWGILKRDVALTDALVTTKERHGYPKKFRAAFAKNSNDVVFEISKKLSDAGMLKATTLALQSMKDETLGLIKRKNIKHEKLAELSARYEAAGISTYAEIIVGLPGETFESFIDGLDALLEAGQHDSISIYLCMLLENTEMAQPEYRRAHGIESVPMKALLYHGTPEPGIVEEIQDTVVATTMMPRRSLRCAVLYSWMLQALHGFGLTQFMARELHRRGMPYQTFYKRAFSWLTSGVGTTGQIFEGIAQLWDDAVEGKSWATVDARFGDVSWPPEELLFLRLAAANDAFYDELRREFVEEASLVDVQRSLFIPPAADGLVEYAREAVWYGRKGSGKKLRLKD